MTEQHYLTKHYTSYTVWDEKTIIWEVEKFLLSFIKNYICSGGIARARFDYFFCLSDDMKVFWLSYPGKDFYYPIGRKKVGKK